jgi:phospholipid-translocating ATPase
LGLFDRIIGKHVFWLGMTPHSRGGHPDSDVLMDIPELYRYGREGTWFGPRLFTIYMLDGVYQVCFCLSQRFDAEFCVLFQSAVIFFIIAYTYMTETPHADGFNIPQFGFSTVCSFHLFYCP